MSAKSKKRLCKLENKLLILDKLQIKDVICSICQSILIEPVTLPCFHDFCQRCFNGTIENNALRCPLCRLRIGSWLRTSTKRNCLVNSELWDFLNSKFSREIETKLKGEDIDLPEEKPIPRLSVPGEIRSEYEAELQRLRAERLQQEQEHIQKTELLIKKIQQEERKAQREYNERLKQDELLAKEIQKQEGSPSKTRKTLRPAQTCGKVPNKIDSYLAKLPNVPKKLEADVKDSPVLTDDASSCDASTKDTLRPNGEASPELVPSYTSLIKNYFTKKLLANNKVWDKDGDDTEMKGETASPAHANKITNTEEVKKGAGNSLLVSLPLPNTSALQQMNNTLSNKLADSDSVDSMQQELCYFKPIEKVSCFSSMNKVVPIRVPCVRATKQLSPPPPSPLAAPSSVPWPSHAALIESFCMLRQLSLAKNRLSAFVIPPNILTMDQSPAVSKSIVRRKKTSSDSPDLSLRRRTRSMGSLAKDENETTPKKAKVVRKAYSERKAQIRSTTKRSSTKKIKTPTRSNNNNNKVTLAVKNLSSPLKNCDVKQILQEQLRIEKIIEQEKKDLELARQMDAELNGRRHLRRAPAKRQMTISYALKAAKKVKA